MTLSYMPRQKRETVTRSTRLITEISEALDKYADDQLISQNAALNQLLKEILTSKGYIKEND